MKNIILKLFVILLFNSWGPLLFAQDYTFFNPKGSFAIEVSLENSPYNRMPIYQNAITSLSVSGDYIVGGTSAKVGLSPYVFVASLSKRKLIHKQVLKSVIPGQQSIQSGFCKDEDNGFYAGTMADTSKTSSGHLIKINITTSGNIKISDLGTPISDEGIFALTCNTNKRKLYGISYPSGLFFSYDINNGNTKIYRSTAPTEKEKELYHHFFADPDPQDYLSRDLTVDKQGRVYGSKPVNKLFYYDPKTDNIHILKDHLPTVWARRILGQVDAWTKSKDGILYGANAGDGQFFRLDPSTNKVKNLGKPIMMNRMKCLTIDGNGTIYGIAGAPPGYAHVFSYDTAGEKGFVDLGNPHFDYMTAPGLDQGITWRGFDFATITTSENGKYIVMGEDEALSQLMIFPVANVNNQLGE